MKDFKLRFGKRLKSIRHVKGITQERLSEMVDVNPRHISKLETGGNFPSAKILFRLCVALRVQPWELFGFEIDLDESD